MKKSIIIVGSILCIINLLLGLIISAYGGVNLIVTTAIIILTITILLGVNDTVSLKDGYKVCLNVIVPIIGTIQYLIGIFMPSQFSDNWGLITILVLIAIEVILLVAANSISTKIR